LLPIDRLVKPKIDAFQQFNSQEVFTVARTVLTVLARAIRSNVVAVRTRLDDSRTILMERNCASENEIHCFLEPISILRSLHRGSRLPNGYHETIMLDVLQRGHTIGYDFFRHGEIPFTVMDWA
jgi:hypothetical protein